MFRNFTVVSNVDSVDIDYLTTIDPDDWTASGNVDKMDGYDVPFNSDGDLDEARIVEYGHASPFECLEIEVTEDNYGSESSRSGITKEVSGVTNSDTPTCTFEIYADCPSVTGNVNISGQLGGATRTTNPTSVPQRQWVSASINSFSLDSGLFRVYFAGTTLQSLNIGDKIYFRNFDYDHPNGVGDPVSYDSDFSSGIDGFGAVAETTKFSIAGAEAPSEELGVTTWYDQSGNGNDATQTTFANTPNIYQYNSTTKDYRVSRENGAAKLTGDGTESLDISISIPADSGSFFAVNKPSTTGDEIYCAGTNFRLRTSSGNHAYFAGATGYVTSTENTSNELAIRTAIAGTSDKVGTNGGSFATGNAGSLATTISSIRVYDSFQEFIIYTSDKSSNRSDIEDNIDAHFRITNDLDATQSTDANQPQVVDNGSTVTENGKPALINFKKAEGMDFSSTISVTDQSIMFVGEVEYESILVGDNDYAFFTQSTETKFRVNSAIHSFNAVNASVQTHLAYYRDGSTVSAFQDALSLGTPSANPICCCC